MEEVERTLYSLNFSKLNRIEDSLLKNLLADRKLKRDNDQPMDLEELDSVTAAGSNFFFRCAKPKV